MIWLIAFATAQLIAAFLTVNFVKGNLGDDFYRYDAIGETETRSLDIFAIALLQLSLSLPIIVVLFLLITIFGKRRTPKITK